MSMLTSSRLRRAFGPVELVALAVVVALVLGAALGPWLISTDPVAQALARRADAPGLADDAAALAEMLADAAAAGGRARLVYRL